MKVAVVGATGMVGQVMRDVLDELDFPVTELIPVASERSVGKELDFKGQKVKVVGMEDAIALKPEIALFSAGGNTSKLWAEKFAEAGTTVIDNSSAWRMDDSKRLVVPEINAGLLTKNDKIIANPNCSTIQLVMVLNPLHKRYGVKRVVISTYQSITGTGVKAVQQLNNEREGVKGEMAYPYLIDGNCLPHCDDFTENGYTKEEMKLVNETKKIIGDDSIKVTATAVRVPVQGGHSEAVNIEFENEFDVAEVRKVLADTPGVTLQDNPDTNTYPMPRYSEGKNETFVGRIRRDETQEKTLNLWIVADNLRKGAATNTVQIAQYLADNDLV
ncbi:MAG: aspartate-semialdehyde dehydrogenase [Crocinitomicaceae bacterium]|nr:aspartate-semialdehyde dehydrogenase [Crocinitomicaceae bacterium]|tara:strand:- start:11406 stop:12395 length:990 start_codon:yes stop_codon:yes gene_type:complete